MIASVAWSPDGKRVAILGRYADPDPSSQGLPVKNVSHSIIICDADGKNAKTIFEVKEPTNQ